MKIWYGYGSEHSANLVLIGEFKTEEDAERVLQLIQAISANASSDLENGVVNHWAKNEQFSEKTEQRLRDLNLYGLSPSDIADFALLNPSMEREGKALHFRTDDVEVGGFVKLMVEKGAKVQVYSAHDYPETEAD
jgi:hypothetical protein